MCYLTELKIINFFTSLYHLYVFNVLHFSEDVYLILVAILGTLVNFLVHVFFFFFVKS